MTALAILAAITLVLGAGFGLTMILWRERRPLLALELFGLSWLLGSAVVSASLALLGLVFENAVLTAGVTLVCMGLAFHGSYRILKTNAAIETGLEQTSQWERWTCILILIPIVCFAVDNARVSIAWDGLYIWEFKARSAFIAGGSLPADTFSDPARSRFHPSYPLYLPFTELWIYLWLGDCHQTHVKVIFLLYYASGVALLWSGVYRLTGKVWAGSIIGLLPLFIPAMFNQGYGLAQGYCDFILGTLYFTSLVFLLVWRFQAVNGAWFVASACAATLPWIKQEGIILFGTVAFLACLAHGWRNWKSLFLFIAPGAGVFATWKLALWLANIAPQTVFHPLTWENLVTNAHRLRPIVVALASEFSAFSQWSLLWFLAPIALASMAWHRDRRTAYIAVSLMIPLLGYITPYMFTRLELAFHIQTSLNRLILQLSVTALLPIALCVARCQRPPSPENLPPSDRSIVEQ